MNALLLLALTVAPKPEVVFIAPAELRAGVAQALTAAGKTPHDASEIDVALYGAHGEGGPLQRGELTAEPPATLPKDIADDWRTGAENCAGWKKQSPELGKACGRAVAEAAWQRWLERVKPARVIELHLRGTSLIGITYAPSDREISAFGGPVSTPLTLPPKLVPALLTGESLTKLGNRPNGHRLPGERPPAEADLVELGAADLPKLKIPQGCGPLPAMQFQAKPNPLEKSAAGLWKRTTEGHPAAPGKLQCMLTVEPDIAIRREMHQLPDGAQLACGASATVMSLFPSDDLAARDIQAEIVSALVREMIGIQCAVPVR